jgi:BirA family biotin operon repressor/biotin-[acetyl-CoA-carboxylase] ligase
MTGSIACCGSEIPWFDLDLTSSTMDEAAKLVGEGYTGWAVVSARAQRSGRGTRGREWHSFPGKGLLFSIILPPPGDLSEMNGLTVKAAEALVEALRELTGVRFAIKQPNDVTAGGRKLAGILVESVTCGGKVASVVLGVGVNIAQEREDFSAVSLPEATSLKLETGKVLDGRLIIETFLIRFKPVYDALVFTESNL